MSDAATRLKQFTSSDQHVFWPDNVSVLDPSRLSADKLSGHREITNAYLLGQTVAHGGALATFDTRVRLAAAVGAEAHHVRVLSS